MLILVRLVKVLVSMVGPNVMVVSRLQGLSDLATWPLSPLSLLMGTPLKYTSFLWCMTQRPAWATL